MENSNSNSKNNNSNNNKNIKSDSNNDDSDEDQPLPQIPYRRDRTPSIVVQSLGLSFQKDANITGSIELPDDDDTNDQDSSPNSSEISDPKSSTSATTTTTTNNDKQDQHAGTCESSGGSARGSSSSSPVKCFGGSVAASGGNVKQSSQFSAPRASPVNLGAANRRLSLNIGSTAPRRQSLTVDGMLPGGGVSSFLYTNRETQPGNATGSLRNKVALKPGHSLMGWIKLAATAKNLSGTNGKILEVTPEELAKHNKEEDCWLALKGNVYNVTTYLHYHPGGIEELMRGAGIDATELFNEVHRWVNYESILAKCLIGPYKVESPLTPTTSNKSSPARNAAISPSSGARPGQTGARAVRDPTVAQKPPRRQSIALTVPSANKYQSLLLSSNSSTNLNHQIQPPTYNIMQDKTCIKVKVQDLNTLQKIRARHVICDLNGRMEFHLSVILSPDWLYRVHLRLDRPVEEHNFSTVFASDLKTITIQLNKREQAIWNKIGTSLELNDSLCEMTLADKFFRPCRLLSKQKITNDTYLFEFDLDRTLMYIPIGWHVLIREHLERKQHQQQQDDQSPMYQAQEDQRLHKNYTPVLKTLTPKEDQDKEAVPVDGATDESGFMKHLYFIIKIYQDGVLTSKLDVLEIGDMVDISDYQCVDFDIEELVMGPARHWILLAAGTGITPYCRTIPYLLSQANKDCIDSVTLVFFNRTQNDIIWRDQFDKLARDHKDRFKFINVLSNEPASAPAPATQWTGKRGIVSRELLAELVGSKNPRELQVLSCGPRVFNQLTKSIMAELNLPEKLYIFHG